MITLAAQSKVFRVWAAEHPFVELTLTRECGPTISRRLPAYYLCGELSFLLDATGLSGAYTMTVRSAPDAIAAPGGVIFGPYPIYVTPTNC